MNRLGTLLAAGLVGGILGGLVGQLLGFWISSGWVHDVFVRGFPVGLQPPLTLDLKALTLTFGFQIWVNLFSLVGFFLGVYWVK